jgi:HEAT repeat protein
MAPVIAILWLTAVCIGGANTLRAQEVDQMQKFQRALESASEDERCQAVTQLSAIDSEAASRLLLKQLKRNLANKRGFYVKYDSIDVPSGIVWTSTRSENELLVTALGKRKYRPALETFRKILKMNEKWLGFSKELVAANIYLFSPQPVTYSVNGDEKVYPAPDTYSDLMTSFLLPATGELAWAENSPNDQLRDIVALLGQASGPLDSHPLYKILRDDIGRAKLVELVKGNDPLPRAYAVEALGILGEQRNETLALLMVTIGDPEPRVRVRSVRALSRMFTSGNESEFGPIVPALIRALHDPEAEVRYYAIAPLARYILSNRADMNTVRDVMGLLVSTLNDRAVPVRAEAAHVLGWVGPLTPQVVPSLIHLLESQKADDREAATNGLGQLLQTDSFKQSPQRRLWEDQIWQAFAAVARDPASSVRYQLAEVLGWTAPATPRAVPMLIKLTRDPSSGVRTAAARALGEFEIDRLRITSALAAMLNVPEEVDEVIEFALSALSELGTEARTAAPELRKLLRNNRPRLHDSILDTLEKIGAPQKP